MSQARSSNCLLLLFGIPGAGKTRLATQLLRGVGAERDHWKFLHVCVDQFQPVDSRAKLADRELWRERGSVSDARSDEERFYLKPWRKRLNGCLEKCLACNVCHGDRDDKQPVAVEEALWTQFVGVVNESSPAAILDLSGRILCSEPVIFLIDDNLYLQSMRYEYYQLARKYSCGFAELLLACQLEVALSRNSQRKLPIPGHTVTNMAGSIEPPAPDKHHWEKHSARLDNSAGVGADEAWEIMAKLCQLAVDSPEQPPSEEDELMKESCRSANLDNVVHQADQILRQCVSNEIDKHKGCPKEHLSKIAQRANNSRKALLDQLKGGILLPRHKDINVGPHDDGFRLYWKERFLELVGAID